MKIDHIDWLKMGKLIRERRGEKKLSQASLAHELGISQGAVSLIERGSPTGLTDDRFLILQSFLDISDEEIPPNADGKSPTVGRRVFISYSHKDKEFVDRLLVHLRPLEKRQLIDTWVDTKISAGERWKEKIQEALKNARAAILLISADFLASDFIVDNELPPLLKSAEQHGTAIIPMILKPCRFTRESHLAEFQSINSPDETVLGMEEHDRELVYDSVARRIETLFAKELMTA